MSDGVSPVERPDFDAVAAEFAAQLHAAAGLAIDAVHDGVPGASEHFRRFSGAAAVLLGNVVTVDTASTEGRAAEAAEPATTGDENKFDPFEQKIGDEEIDVLLRPGAEKSLADLPDGFRQAAINAYLDLTLGLEDAGVASERFPLPDLDQLKRKLQWLATVYKTMGEKEGDWQPRVVFVPRGLSDDEWSNLLSDYPVGASVSQGIKMIDVSAKPVREAIPYQPPRRKRFWRRGEDAEQAEADAKPREPVEPPKPLPLVETVTEGPVTWDVAVISNAPEPPISQISRDGFGPGATGLGEKCAGLRASAAAKPGEVMNVLTPDRSTYLALQWARLARGDTPVDAAPGTLTLLKNTVPTWNEYTLAAGWNSNDSVVAFAWPHKEETIHNGGLRPAVVA